MATPLSPAQNTLNFATPPTSRRYEKYEVRTVTTQSSCGDDNDSTGSSPFVSTVNETRDQENMSPSKSRHTRVLSGNELSPLKILAEARNMTETSPDKQTPTFRSPRKPMSPIKRFPVKVSNPIDMPAPVVQEREMSLEDAIRENEGLKRAIDVLEDEASVLGIGEDGDEDMTTSTIAGFDQRDNDLENDEAAGPDDTMMSTFSTFSAVPNMTMFARLGNSPNKHSSMGGLTPRARPDPTPTRTSRPTSFQETGNTTNLLMDFTEQVRFPQKSPTRRGNTSPTRSTHMHSTIAGTPTRQMSNLIDFDIPPLPTPRSIPTITPRELESLKSNFLSEISSLKASLSGKEAEVHSLKSAVGDAEQRVGECMEQVREERSLKDQLSADRESWERRGREMESVLRKVKEEIVLTQREREELDSKLAESEQRREAAETMAQEAESKLAGMRAGKATEEREKSGSPEKARSPGGSSSSKEVELAVERVARELHALYKSKHESKVTALKKSYENRWEKKVRELENKVDELSEDNERLRLGRDATMTKVDPVSSAVQEERKVQAAKDSAQIKELEATVEKLEAVVKTVKDDNAELRTLLEQERVEKGELVQLAEEMMSMQSFVATDPQNAPATRAPVPAARVQQTVENLRGSISRASGLKAPGSMVAESRIGRVGHERTRSSGPAAGLPRPGSGLAGRSGIMSSIEKMGNYRGRGD